LEKQIFFAENLYQLRDSLIAKIPVAVINVKINLVYLTIRAELWGPHPEELSPS